MIRPRSTPYHKIMPYHRNKPRAQCTCCGSPDRDARGLGEETEEGKEFRDERWYWDMYNEISDKYDEDMMERLNTSLDNLLIFMSRLLPVTGIIIIDSSEQQRQAFSRLLTRPSLSRR